MRDIKGHAGETKPRAEIKVTDEMIAAGAEVFCSYDERFESPEKIVAQIYLAMSSASTSGTG